MTLPVTPPDRTLNEPHLVVDKERRRSPHAPVPFAPGPVEPFHDEPLLDSVAPVSVEAGTGAALADLTVIDAVPLSVAISHYSEAD